MSAALLQQTYVAEKARVRMRLVRDRPEYREAVRSWLLQSLHERQRGAVALIEQGERYISLCCGRRGGKTRLIATLIALFLLDLAWGQEVVFVAPTLKRGKELIWAELARIVEHFQLAVVPRAHEGTMRTSRGGMFRIVGLDNQKQIGKIARGGNTRAMLADEVQEFSHLLQGLLDAATPALGQTRGIFIASGTPGFVRRGYWFSLCHGADGFRNVSWTLYDNPYLGRPAAEIVEEEIARKGWPCDHPTLLREWFAQWVDDAARKVFELSPDNVVDELVGYSVAGWRHVIGVDYGNAPDPCAWVVLAAHPHENLVLVVHAERAHRLTSDQICERTNALRVKYGAKCIVGDSASGGKTFIQDFNERHARKAGFYMRSADKADKRDSIDLVNTELRRMRLRVLRKEAALLVEEMSELQWDDEHREFLPGNDHVSDATRYAHRAIRAFMAKPEQLPLDEAQQELEIVKARNLRAQRSRMGGFFG